MKDENFIFERSRSSKQRKIKEICIFVFGLMWNGERWSLGEEKPPTMRHGYVTEVVFCCPCQFAKVRMSTLLHTYVCTWDLSQNTVNNQWLNQNLWLLSVGGKAVSAVSHDLVLSVCADRSIVFTYSCMKNSQRIANRFKISHIPRLSLFPHESFVICDKNQEKQSWPLIIDGQKL